MNEKKKLRRLPKRILSFVLTMAMIFSLMPKMSVKVEAAGNPTTWKELQEAINDVPDYDWEAEEPVKITLGADIIANYNDEFLKVGNYDQFDATKNKEIYVKIDLNGHKIDRCLTQATEEGYVIKIGRYSILEIEDSSQAKTGKITGGYNDGDGGGIYCGASSELRLYSGSICGNKATGAGGGVFEFANCWFTMYGGSIQNNESNYDYGGGAIGLNYYSDAYLYGGVISGNKTDSGCAFSFDEDTDFYFGGTIQITGNTTNGVERNFDFEKLYHAFIASEKPLTTDAQIGIYAEQPPCTNRFGGLTDDNVQYIKSDKTGYECSCPENGSLRIAKKTHKWTYAESGNQLTATCDKGCDEKITHTATLSLSASDVNYSGNAVTYGDGTDNTKNIKITGYDNWKTLVDSYPKLQFSSDNGSSWSDTVPKDIGSYKVRIFPDAESKNPVHILTGDFSILYDQSAFKAYLVPHTLNPDGTTADTNRPTTGNYTYYIEGNSSKKTTLPYNGVKKVENGEIRYYYLTLEAAIEAAKAGKTNDGYATDSNPNGAFIEGTENDSLNSDLGKYTDEVVLLSDAQTVYNKGARNMQDKNNPANTKYGIKKGIIINLNGHNVQTIAPGYIPNDELLVLKNGSITGAGAFDDEAGAGTLTGKIICSDININYSNGSEVFNSKHECILLSGNYNIKLNDSPQLVELRGGNYKTNPSSLGGTIDENKYHVEQIAGDYPYKVVKIPVHQHDWRYSATSNKLEAYCANEGCPSGTDATHKVSLTLSATSPNYSGSAVEVTMDTTAWEAAGLTAPMIVYEAKNGSALTDSKAVNVGSYTAKITVDGKTASKDFEIISESANKSSFKEPEKVFVDLDTNKSEVAYGTVFMHNKDNVRNIFDMKVHSVDARTKANQEFLTASYAKNQGKRARIIITTGIYPRNKLAAKDIGAKKFLSFINLEKKIMPVYAVCYNQTDKAYYLTGTMNANGTAVFNDFIARDATNITIFVLE